MNSNLDKAALVWRGIAILDPVIIYFVISVPVILKTTPLSCPLPCNFKFYHAKNDGNYCMAIYEGKDKSIYPVAPEKNGNLNELKYILTKGKMVLIYDKSPKELFELVEEKLLEWLFEITQLDVEDSGIKLLHHAKARPKEELTKFMNMKSGMKGGKNLGEHKKYPWIKLGVNSFDCLVEDYDFTISATGKISFK